MTKERKVDVEVARHGTIFTFHPMTHRARKWINQNVTTEEWQWLGTRLVVDHHYAENLAAGMVNDGLRLR